MPKQDSERALSALERWAADPARPVILLTGATQSGKTVLLDVLAARLGRYFSVVYLAQAGTDPDELSARILAELGDPADGTPRLVLAREIERRAARPLLLLLDDADALPPRIELWLFDLARRSEGALRLVLALSAEVDHLEAALASFGRTPVEPHEWVRRLPSEDRGERHGVA
jgi:predicted AAA+ superfamily ATPase